MIDSRFVKKKVDFLALKQVVKITKSKLEDGNSDIDCKINGVFTLDEAIDSEISFINSGQYVSSLINSKAGFCFMEKKFLDKKPDAMIALINDDPYFAYSVLLKHFYEDNSTFGDNSNGSDFVAESVVLGKNVRIMAGAYVGNNVKIGDDVFVGPNSVIEDNVEIGSNSVIKGLVNISNAVIGKNAIIHSGVKIGQDGFGFVHNKGVNHKILQLGIVEIGDNVEIGSNSCIDRGAIGNTKISNQVKLDNLVQIAHNVQIGEGTFIAGATCVAGSAKIGRFCQIGGNCSINGHISIGDGVRVAGASGVVKSIDPMGVVGGLPAVPIKDWHRITLKMLKLIRK